METEQLEFTWSIPPRKYGQNRDLADGVREVATRRPRPWHRPGQAAPAPIFRAFCRDTHRAADGEGSAPPVLFEDAEALEEHVTTLHVDRDGKALRSLVKPWKLSRPTVPRTVPVKAWNPKPWDPGMNVTLPDGRLAQVWSREGTLAYWAVPYELAEGELAVFVRGGKIEAAFNAGHQHIIPRRASTWH